MDHRYIISALENNLSVFTSLLRKSNPDEYLYKRDTDSWSMLEIVCHLVDEEREDFRMRLQTVLSAPFKHPPHIDPEGWVLKRDYINQDYGLKVNAFIEERQSSISYLKTLTDPQWTNYYEHPVLGNLDGNHFLANWLAHDYLHIRQLTQRKYQYLQHMSGNACDYAGVW